MSEERKKHISHLKAILRCCERVSSGTGNCGDDCDNCELQYAKGNMGEIKDTLAYAISSLETDEAYQLEYERTTKNDLANDVHDNNVGNIDCISRADAIHAVSEALKRTFVEHEDIANKLIGKLPSVTPQEPRPEWEQDHAILKAYSDGVNEVLDKIRAEIENDWQLKKYPSSPFSCGLRRAIEIIDKYKAETEET